MKPICRSKTFQKGEDFFDLNKWICEQVEVEESIPEGTEWIGGEPTPFDPRSDLKDDEIKPENYER